MLLLKAATSSVSTRSCIDFIDLAIFVTSPLTVAHSKRTGSSKALSSRRS